MAGAVKRDGYAREIFRHGSVKLISDPDNFSNAVVICDITSGDVLGLIVGCSGEKQAHVRVRCGDRLCGRDNSL